MSIKTWRPPRPKISTGSSKKRPYQPAGVAGAGMGVPADVAAVKKALQQIRVCLVSAGIKNRTADYLKDINSHKTTFSNGVARLLRHVDGYLGTSERPGLYVARGNIRMAFASCRIKSGSLGLANDGGTDRGTFIMINPAFTNAYSVGGVGKVLTDWGRCTTVLHELTHGLLRTHDVWKKHAGPTYGLFPKDADNGLTTDAECKELALVDDTCKALPLCWMNAENWTRAIALCHPTRHSDAMTLIL